MNTTTATQTVSHTAPNNADVSQVLTAVWIQPGMAIAFHANGRIVSGAVTASAAVDDGPRHMIGNLDATPKRILATVGGTEYALDCAHAVHVTAGRELARNLAF